MFKALPKTPTTTSKRLDETVQAYRNGDSQAAETIIREFEPLIAKYYRLLTQGTWIPEDRDAAAFLSMLGSRNPQRTAANLAGSLGRICEPEDIRQELVAALLVTAQRYVNVSANFRYVLKERIEAMLEGAIFFDQADDSAEIEGIPLPAQPTTLGEAWVMGFAAGEGFDVLTPRQRAILRCLYWEDIGVAATARRFDMTPRHVLRIKAEACVVLAAALGMGTETRVG